MAFRRNIQPPPSIELSYYAKKSSIARTFPKINKRGKGTSIPDSRVGDESILLDLTLECRNKIPRICVFLIEIFVVDPLTSITDLLKILRD